VTWTTGQNVVLDGGFMATGLGYFGAARRALTGGDKLPAPGTSEGGG
jgi:hypothetical protein